MLTTYKTDRLVLNILNPSRAGLVLDFYSKNRDFLEPHEPARTKLFYTLEFHRANLSCEYNSFIKQTHIRYWIFLGNIPDKLIGSVCFSNILKGAFSSCMIGYKLGMEYCGNGYMQEALSMLIPAICKAIPLHRIEAMVMPSNLPSIKLLGRMHFTEEGYLHSFAQINGVWEDHLLYSYLYPGMAGFIH